MAHVRIVCAGLALAGPMLTTFPAPARADTTGDARGISYGAAYTAEALSNLSGGLQRGSLYQGKLEGYVSADLEKPAGLTGLSFHLHGFQIHGTGGIGRDYVGSLNTISNIEALPATRLSELWLEQKFAGDTFGIRFGQLTADAEFFISDTSRIFTTSDWPSIAKQNLPAGAAAYPLSTPGLRLKFEPTRHVSFLAAIFNGDPAGPGPGDPEEKNRHGLNFRVNDPPLAIAELQYRHNQEKDARGLAGIYRLGAWHHFGKFDDQRMGMDGLPLADPAGSGIARRLRGNSGIYGVIDQQIYRPAGGDAESGVSIFSRISVSPSDRNLIGFYLDGGFVVTGLISGRPEDKFGVTFIYSRIAGGARGFDQDTIFYSGIPQPVRDYELSFEATYLARIAEKWTLQPVLQYIVHPGGRVPDPNAAAGNAIRNATVIGLRSVITY